MKRMLIWLAAIVATTTSATPAVQAPTARGNTETFSFNLFRKLVERSPRENVIISPLSVNIAMSMTINGAAGNTRKQLAEGLGFDSKTNAEINQANKTRLDSLRKAGSKVILEIADGLFGRKDITLQPQFLQQSREFYDAKVSELDFGSQSAPKTINAWVSEKTHGKIGIIVDSLSQNAVMVLVNAVYFKGKWSEQFSKSQTKTQPFTLANGSKVDVPMMRNSGLYDYFQNRECEALRLPYIGQRISMEFFLPKGQSLPVLAARLTPEKWREWQHAFTSEEAQIGVPRLRLNDKHQLADTLSSMGMTDAFNGGKANFKDMAQTKQPVYLSEVLHKTFLEVNEEGTEAAAVTGVQVAATAAPIRVKIVLDHPFLFAITDNQTGEILFLGQINNPTAAGE